MRNKLSKLVRQVTEYEVTFRLHCNQFKPSHAFSNVLIGEEMLKAIRKSDNVENNLWNNRLDTNIDIDVFYIENDILTSQDITIYFSLTLTCYAANEEFGSTVSKALTKSIEQLEVANSEIEQMFVKALISRMQIFGSRRVASHRATAIKISHLKILKNQTELDQQKVNINLFNPIAIPPIGTKPTMQMKVRTLSNAEASPNITNTNNIANVGNNVGNTVTNDGSGSGIELAEQPTVDRASIALQIALNKNDKHVPLNEDISPGAAFETNGGNGNGNVGYEGEGVADFVSKYQNTNNGNAGETSSPM